MLFQFTDVFSIVIKFLQRVGYVIQKACGIYAPVATLVHMSAFFILSFQDDQKTSNLQLREESFDYMAISQTCRFQKFSFVNKDHFILLFYNTTIAKHDPA